MTDHTHQNSPARTAGEKALAGWREAAARTRAAFQASNNSVPNDDLERAYRVARAHSERLAREAWARPASADLQLRAEIVKDAVWTDYEDSDGSRRFDDVLLGIEPAEGLAFGEFDERAVAELVKAVLWTAKAASARSKPSARDWLALLRDAGPDGAAPDAHHAAIWGDLLDLREVRDTIGAAVERMTAKLDHLADETALTHVIAAGGEPEDEAEAPTPAADSAQPGTLDSTSDWQMRTDIEQLWSGITTMHVLINSRRGEDGGLDQDATTSLLFCVDSMSQLSERIDELLAEVEVRCKREQPADAPAPS